MKADANLSGLIRKELGREPNRQFLNRMRTFKVEDDLPPQLGVLLGEIDRAEKSARRRGRNN